MTDAEPTAEGQSSGPAAGPRGWAGIRLLGAEGAPACTDGACLIPGAAEPPSEDRAASARSSTR